MSKQKPEKVEKAEEFGHVLNFSVKVTLTQLLQGLVDSMTNGEISSENVLNVLTGYKQIVENATKEVEKWQKQRANLPEIV